MPCIYPGPHSDQMSVEHPVPYALGRFSGFALLRDRVCRACNTEIGNRIQERQQTLAEFQELRKRLSDHFSE